MTRLLIEERDLKGGEWIWEAESGQNMKIQLF